MEYFKSIISGIGTAAGVAWPLFGIAFGAVGAAIGGLASLALGGVAIGLFISITAAIFYLSHQKAQEEQQKFKAQLQKNEQKLMGFIDEYIKISYINYQSSIQTIPFKTYLALQLEQQLSVTAQDEKQATLHQVLIIIKTITENPDFKRNAILPGLKQQIINSQPAPYFNTMTPAFFAFVGTFGSIAGCSAGVSGLLNGLGLFSSFAAFPILGWGILGIAVAMGLFAAGTAFIEARENYRNQLLNQRVKTMYQDLKKEVFSLTHPLMQNTSDLLTNKAPRNFPALFQKDDVAIQEQLESTEKIAYNQSGH